MLYNNGMSQWQRISSRTVYQNSRFSLHEDNVIEPSGQASVYTWIESPPSVLVVALDNRHRLALVEQNRFVINAPSLELPGGSTDGQDPLDMAQRELAEEAGYMAEHWQLLPHQTYPFIGRTPEYSLVYIAQTLHKLAPGIRHTSDNPEATKFVTWNSALKLIKDGTITNGQTIAALMLAGIHLGHIK